MRLPDILSAWGRILTGFQPVLSIEITKECPLSCPGCYAFQPDHLGGVPLTSLSDFKGSDLVDRVLHLVREERPLLVYIVGGEPLVRFRELNRLLPKLSERKIEVRLVTSAVRPIPREWAFVKRLGIVVSIDGLPPEHDRRRKPATYERILKHIEGHRITVHCTLTSHMMQRDGYLEEFVHFWSERPETESIQVSMFTPQKGEWSEEILSPAMRTRAVAELERLGPRFPKVRVNPKILAAFLEPPPEPKQCVFARVTRTISADLETVVAPCQFGGTPDCSQCGCLASMGLHAVGRHKVLGLLPITSVLVGSQAMGAAFRRVREKTPTAERRTSAAHGAWLVRNGKPERL